MKEHVGCASAHRHRLALADRCAEAHPAIFLRLICLLLLASVAVAAEPAKDFAAYQGGGPLLGQAPAFPAPPYKLRWTYRTDETDRVSVDASPVVSGQTAYVADAAGTLHAIDLATGKARWTCKTENGFATTPLVMDGKVILGDLVGLVHAVAADTGKALWKFDSEAGIHSSANAAGNSILFGNDANQILCLDAGTGKLLWKAEAGDRVNSTLSIADGLAFSSGCDSHLRAIDIATGKEKFAADLGNIAPGAAALIGGNAIIGTDGGRLVCMNIDPPKQAWVYEGVENQAMVYATPAIADGIIVAGARDRQIHAIDLKTGQKKWAFRTRGDVNASPLISDGRVFIPSRDKKLYVLDLKTGDKLWEFQAGRAIEAGVAIGGGVLILADTAGNVYCLEP